MGPGEPYSTDKLPEEYAALGDRVQVMAEVVALVEQVRVANKKLGDVLVSAGLPAREWLGPRCELSLLSDQFQDVTLDALLSRLAEFAAGTGPHWLRGGMADIERFNDEASILCEAVRVLRHVAQRQRMLPVRQRGDLALQRALGEARVGTQLDRMAAALRDLESLAPYIAPLAPEDWARPPLAPEPEPAPSVASGFAAAFAPLEAETPATPSAAPVMPQGAQAAPIYNYPPAPKPAAPRPPNISRRLTAAMVGMATQARAVGERLEPRKWLVVAVTAGVLATSTGVVGLLVRGNGAPAPAAASTPSHLAALPTSVTLTCSGRGAVAALTLRNTGNAALTWSAQPPSWLILSATHGVLKQGAGATLTIVAHSTHSARGTLTFTSSLGSTSVAYTLTCG